MKKIDVFEALAHKARVTRDSDDIKIAMRYGIENRVSVQKIRQLLS